MTELHAPAVPALVMRRTFNAPRERVYDAWTKPEVLRTVLAPGDVTVSEIQLDVRVGGSYRVVMVHPDGEKFITNGVYRELRKPERIVMTWQWEEDDPKDMHETLLTLEFNEAGAGQTEFVLTHEKLASIESRGRHEHGWGSVLEKLQQAVS